MGYYSELFINEQPEKDRYEGEENFYNNQIEEND